MGEVDESEHTCSIRECDDMAILDAEVECNEQVRQIHICRRHVPHIMGGAVFMEMLKEVEGD